MLVQFDRDRHGGLYDRGQCDSWYLRPPSPHWYPDGTYHGSRIENLTQAEITEYLQGYHDNEMSGNHKDYS